MLGCPQLVTSLPFPRAQSGRLAPVAGGSERPRLGSHVQARRHLVGEVAHVILHDGSRALAIGDREWSVLRQADGTRDLEGICLAARRAGAPARIEHVRAFFEELGALGLLEERDLDEEPPAFAPDLPIAPLPGYRFRCDGSGDCCRQFDTMLFTPTEVVRARAALPELGDERVFLPQHGVDSELAAVTRRDGACLYFDTSLGCRIHPVKPTACRVFPMRYVVVGDTIRVAPRPECACVFRSATDPEGEPLASAARGSELPREVFVPALPERIRMGPDTVGPGALAAVLDAARERVEASHDDLALFAWSLAERVERDGARAAIDAPPLDPPPSLPEHLCAVRESLERIARTHLAWRGEDDRVRLAVEATRRALERLSCSPLPFSLPEARSREDERLYLRALLFTMLGAERDVAAELRGRALAIWIARAIDDDVAHPLATVEALARGHGLALGNATQGSLTRGHTSRPR